MFSKHRGFATTLSAKKQAFGALLVLAPPRSLRETLEPWWNPRSTLVEPYLRAAPDHPELIWAETPKLSAVGEKGSFLEKGAFNILPHFVTNKGLPFPNTRRFRVTPTARRITCFHPSCSSAAHSMSHGFSWSKNSKGFTPILSKL